MPISVKNIAVRRNFKISGGPGLPRLPSEIKPAMLVFFMMNIEINNIKFRLMLKSRLIQTSNYI